MPRFCEFTYSDGTECDKPAVGHIMHASIDESCHWYCVEHYDHWMDYYQRVAQGDFHNTGIARRILRESRQ